MRKLLSLFSLLCLITICTSCSDDKITEPDTPINPEPPVEEPTPQPSSGLHVEGRYLKNSQGETVTLHGFAQTYSPYFNENVWGNYDVSGCLKYNKNLIDRMLTIGWKMDFIRLHMDPYWSDDTSKPSIRYEGHERFSQERFEKYLDQVFVPMAEYAISKGLYVVMRPPGVCPEKIAVGDDYNQFLDLVWSIVSKHDKIKNNMNVMFELANEPIQILGSDGTYASNGQGHFDALKTFFQSTVDKIRKNANNVIWIPGLAYQSSYSGYANNPIQGENIGYAIHVYPGWYGSDAEEASSELGGTMGGGYEAFQRGWDAQIKPVANIAPILVTEMDWAPAKYNSSWGKSLTGTVGGSGFGANFKYIADNTGNVGWLLFTSCHLLTQFQDAAGTPGAYTFLNDPEACPWPVFHWFQEYKDQSKTEGELTDIKVVNVGDANQILTGSDRYLVVKANYKNGTSQMVTLQATYTSSDPTVIKIDEQGHLTALSDGEVSVTVSYVSKQGIRKELSFPMRATTFPFTSEMFNPSIWEKGTFDPQTKTLITGKYGFGGWKYTHGVDLSGYKYLVVELNADNECNASLRLFDENNYWSSPASYDFGSSRRIVVELTGMYNAQQKRLNPAHIYIIGFWSLGSKPIVIKDVYLSNNK